MFSVVVFVCCGLSLFDFCYNIVWFAFVGYVGLICCFGVVAFDGIFVGCVLMVCVLRC